MEEESFEDEEIATRLNADYVAIKVDREERPDVDATYLQAVALLTGGGGWPMTVWLTPDREVFFAGTYFPPRDGERGVRMGFLSLLRHFSDAYRADRASIVGEGRSLTARVHAAANVRPADEMPGRCRARRRICPLSARVRSRARRLRPCSEVSDARHVSNSCCDTTVAQVRRRRS